MRRTTLRILSWMNAFGLDPVKGIRAGQNLFITVRDYNLLKRQNAELAEKWPVNFSSPQLNDKGAESEIAKGHYFHQDLLVARRIFERKPGKHVDVGSRVDGFVAHVAVFREIEVIDIRPISSNVPNIVFLQDDLMNSKLGLMDYCDSLSCLHALEHFGLGRYGDPIDAAGYIKGFAALARMLKTGGILYLSVPIGPDRVEFNGQRVFSIRRIRDLYVNDFELVDFSYVDDAGDLHENAGLTDESINDNFDLQYGCGIFELRKSGLSAK